MAHTLSLTGYKIFQEKIVEDDVSSARGITSMRAAEYLAPDELKISWLRI